MRIKKGSFKNMARDIIENNRKIIIFGTGVIGSVIIPELISQYDLVDRIICCIDNNEKKWGTVIDICGTKVKIDSPDILNTIPYDFTVLISMSRFYNVIDQLKYYDISNKYDCYIIPAMCVNNYHNCGGNGVIKTSIKQIIPKLIHYIWFGGNPLPENLVKCIESWKKFCPEYEIIRWDESNYDVNKNKFISQAYKNRIYPFASDYAKIDILYTYGGIYLDTDVELLRGLNELLYQEAFCSVEKWQVINFGGCSGAVKGHNSLKPFLEKWETRSLIKEDGTIDKTSSGFVDTMTALEYGYKINGINQTVNGMNIYTYDYFHPYDYMTGKLDMTSNTFSIHHFNGGWLDKASAEENKKTSMIYDRIMENAKSVDY